MSLSENCRGEIRGTIFDATEETSCPSFDPFTGYLIGADTSLTANKAFGLADQNNTAYILGLFYHLRLPMQMEVQYRNLCSATYVYDFDSWSDKFVAD